MLVWIKGRHKCGTPACLSCLLHSEFTLNIVRYILAKKQINKSATVALGRGKSTLFCEENTIANTTVMGEESIYTVQVFTGVQNDTGCVHTGSIHTTRSLFWFKITERIEYKLLSVTYKVLATTQPSYLHNLITVQPPRSTRSSSLVTLARQSASSSLRITDRSFQYASPRLENQLPASLRQPHTNLSNSDSLNLLSGTYSIGSIDSPLSSSITASLFHSRLKTFLFYKSFPP